jgi:hypothetical protein
MGCTNQGGKPICFLLEIVSVMTRLAPVRCGKSRPVVSKRGVGALYDARYVFGALYDARYV